MKWLGSRFQLFLIIPLTVLLFKILWLQILPRTTIPVESFWKSGERSKLSSSILSIHWLLNCLKQAERHEICHLIRTLNDQWNSHDCMTDVFLKLCRCHALGLSSSPNKRWIMRSPSKYSSRWIVFEMMINFKQC